MFVLIIFALLLSTSYGYFHHQPHPPFSSSIPADIIDIPDGYNPFGQFPSAARQSPYGYPSSFQYPSFKSYSSYPKPAFSYNPYAAYPSYPMYPPMPMPMPMYNPYPYNYMDGFQMEPKIESRTQIWCHPSGSYCIEPLDETEKPEEKPLDKDQEGTTMGTIPKPRITVTSTKYAHTESNQPTQKPVISSSFIAEKPMQTTITRTVIPGQEPTVIVQRNDENSVQIDVPHDKTEPKNQEEDEDDEEDEEDSEETDEDQKPKSWFGFGR